MQNSELANPKSDEEKSLFDERKVAYIKDEYEAFMVGMFFKACETRDGGLGLNYAFCKDECEAFGVEITEAWGVLGVMLSEAIKSLSQKIR